MTNTIRERIITAFTARAEPLSNQPVARVRRSSTDIKDPFVTIWDGADNAQPSAYSTQKMAMAIDLEYVFRPHVAINASVAANAAIGVVIAAMMSGDTSLGGLADNLQLQAVSPVYPQDGSDIVAIQFSFEIMYTTKRGDPYTQP